MIEWITPFLPLAVEFVAAVLLAVLTAAAARLTKWIGLGNDERVRKYLNEAIERGVDLAEARMMHALGAGRLPTQSEWGDAGMQAARYVRDAVPGALSHFGITPQRLADMIEARLAPRR